MNNKFIQLSLTLLILLSAFKCLANDLDDAKLLNFQANQLVNESKYIESIAASNILISRYSKSQDTLFQQEVVKAYANKAQVFSAQRKWDEAINSFSEIINGFGQSNDPYIQELVAGALLMKGGTLARQQFKPTEGLVCFEEVIIRFSNSTSVNLNDSVINAMYNKSVLLGASHKSDEAIESYNQVIKILKLKTELSFQQMLAASLFNKVILLNQQGKLADSLSCSQEIIQSFEKNSDVTIQQIVANAKSLRNVSVQ